MLDGCAVIELCIRQLALPIFSLHGITAGPLVSKQQSFLSCISANYGHVAVPVADSILQQHCDCSCIAELCLVVFGPLSVQIRAGPDTDIAELRQARTRFAGHLLHVGSH